MTRNSYEREMFDKASLKLGLDKAVLQSMGSDKNTPVSHLPYHANSIYMIVSTRMKVQANSDIITRFMFVDLGETDVEFFTRCSISSLFLMIEFHQ